MLKCIIVDDEAMAVRVLENYVLQIKGLHLSGTFSNALDAFAALQEQETDLLFLDIQMPVMSGLGLLRSLPKPPAVILTTAHREFALESYDYSVVDYLLKPIAFERFLKAVGKVLHNDLLPASSSATAETQEAPFIYVKSDRQFVKILLDDVLYMESIKNHVQIVTTKGKHITLMTISEMEEKLPPQRFIRVHRSFIVALMKIEQFSHTNLTAGNHLIPIGDLYKSLVMRKLSEHLV